MLGHALQDALRRRGVEPLIVDREECDITSRQQVEQLFEEHRPTLLLNCAAHTQVDKCEDEQDLANAINGEGPGNLAEASTKYRTYFTHFSTDFVFNGQSDRPYRPDDATDPLSAYGKSKLIGEQRIQSGNPDNSLVVRTAWLFGRYGACFPDTIVKLAKAGRPLSIVNDQIGCPTYTVDLAATTLDLVERKAKGIFHATNFGIVSWHGFTEAILRTFQMNAEVAPISTAQWLAMRPKQAIRPAYSVLDCSKTDQLIGRSARHWQLALDEYADAVTQADKH
jgi:dTDP-4-dehydrorhamnose reductase